MMESKDLTVKELARNCRIVEDVQEMLKDLFKDTLQEIFEAEMENHLGYEKNSIEGNNSGNSRNGFNKKTLKTRFGDTKLQVPRDRNSEFETQIIGKHQTTANQLEDQIIAMYAKGMSTRDIEDHMKEIYGINVSASMVSKVTDRILPLINEWQNRPLDRIYPIIFLDAIYFKVRKDNRVVNKAAYSVLAINTVFPKTEIQLCVIHQIRNCMKYVSYKEQKELIVDLKKVYQALTLDEAEFEFEAFKEKWEKKHPIIIKSWQNNWLELTT